jgi:hypothetical protein
MQTTFVLAEVGKEKVKRTPKKKRTPEGTRGRGY